MIGGFVQSQVHDPVSPLGGFPLSLAVRLRSAVTVLGRFPALAGVDLDVADREILLVSGPNGAGKTTLLRLLAGLAPLTSGEGSVCGHDLVAAPRAVRRTVGLLGHETFCYDDLDVRANLRFHARAAGRDRSVAEQAIERVGLAGQARVSQRLLSAGQRRRLALGVVLARDARLLLLDEPHAGLDAEGRALLDDVVARAPSEGRTVVMASHELDRARRLAGREVVMAGGHASGAVLDTRESDSGARVVAAR